jgi:putative FmdB family regulatory protein
MPIYEYKCKKGHVFEVKQSFSDEPLTKCEVCGAPVQKVLHAAAIHFKGSGFYNTDYKTKRRAREAKEGKDSSSTSSETSSGSSSSDGGGSSSSEGGGSKSEGATSGAAKPAAPSSPSKSAA